MRKSPLNLMSAAVTDRQRWALLLAGVCTLALPQGPVLAQAAAPSPPTREQLGTLDQRMEQREAPTLTVDGQMERRPCALDNADYAELTINLSEVTFTGSERASDVALAQAYRGDLGRDLPVRALCDIRDRAAALLEEAGYLAAVEIPPQSLGDGKAELAVILGRLVAVRARGDTEGGEQLLAGYLGKLVGQDVFRVADAERYLLLANDIPGANVRLSLRPAAGGAPGDLVGEVAVLRRPYLLDFTVQNYGSLALGRYSAVERAEFYNLTGMGDATSITGYTSLDFKEQQTVQFGHRMKLGSDGLGIAGNLTLGWTRPDALQGFRIESETVFASLETSYPFLRTQELSVWGTAGFDYVDQDVTINGTPLSRDRVRTLWARATLDTLDAASIARRGGYSPFEPMFRMLGEVELRHGVAAFSATPDCRPAITACLTGGAVPPSRIQQNPTPFVLRGQASTQYRPVPLVAFTLDLRGQYSDSPLPAFEEFSAGNYSIGRGYDPSTLVGDSGLGAGLELSYGSLRPDAADKIAWQVYAFTDVAHTWQNDPGASALSPDKLWSAGGGLRFVYGGNAQGDVTLAVPLEKDRISGARDVRLLFTLSARLSPWSSR